MVKKDYARIAVLLAAGTGILGYAYLTPPARTTAVLEGLTRFAGISSDLATYAERFLLAFLLLGALPAAAVFFFRCTAASSGLSFRISPLKPLHLLAMLFIGLATGWIVALHGGMDGYYPYAASLPMLVGEHGWGVFLAHATAYLFLFYLPWEFLFRGLLILPFIRLLERRTSPANAGKRYPGRVKPESLGIASLQAIPSALLHFGHPSVETFGAVIFGVFLGYLVVKTRSILPGLIIHFLVGICLDLTIFIRSLGSMP